jgi:hypothetical protein
MGVRLRHRRLSCDRADARQVRADGLSRRRAAEGMAVGSPQQHRAAPPQSTVAVKRSELEIRDYPCAVCFAKAVRNPSVVKWRTRCLLRIRHSDDLPTFAIHIAITRPESDQKPTGTSSPDIHFEQAVEMVPASIDPAHSSSIKVLDQMQRRTRCAGKLVFPVDDPLLLFVFFTHHGGACTAWAGEHKRWDARRARSGPASQPAGMRRACSPLERIRERRPWERRPAPCSTGLPARRSAR